MVLIRGRYVTHFLHDFSIPSQHHIYSLLRAASLHTHQLPEWSGGRFHINNKLFLICLPGMAWFGYYVSALGGGLVQQVARVVVKKICFLNFCSLCLDEVASRPDEFCEIRRKYFMIDSS